MTTLILLYLGIGCLSSALANYAMSACDRIVRGAGRPGFDFNLRMGFTVVTVVAWPWYGLVWARGLRAFWIVNKHLDVLDEQAARELEQARLRLKDLNQTAGSTQMKKNDSPP